MKKSQLAIVIDDTEAVRNTISNWLKEGGISVIKASDGQEAYERILEKESQLTLIVCDFYLPIMNGIELLRKLEENNIGKNIPKVLLSTETPKLKELNFNSISNYKCWLLKPLEKEFFIKNMEKIGFFK